MVKERDFLAKIVSLLLAVILWAFIAAGKTETLRFRIPITVNNLSAEFVISSMSDTYASIVVEGPRDRLKGFSVRSIKAFVDLEGATPGEPGAYPITLEKRDVSEDVSVTLVNEAVTVTLEARVEKWIDVIPNIVGEVRKGKIIIDKTIFPERVRISGPRSSVAGIDSIMTQPVTVENEAGDIQRQVGLEREDLDDLQFSERVFAVKVVIADMKDLTILTVPAVMRNENKDYEYEIREPDVEIYVRSRQNRVIAPDEVEVFIDAGKIFLKGAFDEESAGEVFREVPVSVLGRTFPGSDIISIMPKKKTVRITRKQAEPEPEPEEKDGAN
jgi:cell division ATPase FtsA